MAAYSLSLGACGGSDDEGDAPIDNSDLTGVIGGVPWTDRSGRTNPFLSAGGDDLAAELSSEHFFCGEPPQGDVLVLSLPPRVGEYTLSPSRSATFRIGNENLTATEGLIVVEAAGETFVRGRLHVRYDDDNEVGGFFLVQICN